MIEPITTEVRLPNERLWRLMEEERRVNEYAAKLRKEIDLILIELARKDAA